MGCAASVPLQVDTLPIKAHCRTAFSRCSTTERAVGQTSEKAFADQSEDGHDVVLCYPLGGTVFGLELQARYEKMDSVSLWTLDHFLSMPGTPVGVTKSMSGEILRADPEELGMEIKPAPEAAAAALSSNMALTREVRTCRRGVLVLLTAGCTWDDGVLNCLRLVAKFLRPLVMVHCVQSCPLPALEEWPPDVRPLIASSGPPVKYLTQHSMEALRDVEQRMLVATAALEAAAAAAAGKDAAPAQQGNGKAVPQQGHSQGATAPQTPPQLQEQRPQQRPRQQQQPPEVSVVCSCLDGDDCLGPMRQPPARPQQRPGPGADATATGPANGGAVASPRDTAGSGEVAPGPSANGLPMPGPYSLAALQATNSDICRRALQLLGPWTCEGEPQCVSGESVRSGGGGGAAAAAGATSTPVESISGRLRGSVSSVQSDRSLGAAQAAGQSPRPLGPATRPPGANGEGAGGAAASSSSLRRQSPQPTPTQQQHQQQPQAEPQRRTGGGGAAAAGGGGGVGNTRCLLRYHDPSWAAPVAFVCAQLEIELGRSNVSVQVASCAASAQQNSPTATGGNNYIRVSLQSIDSGQQSYKLRQQQQQQATAAAVSAAMSAVAAAAATAALRGSGRSSSSSSISTSSAVPRAGVGASGTTSHLTSCGASPQLGPKFDDELESFATLPADDCKTPSLPTPVTTPAAVRTPAGAVAGSAAAAGAAFPERRRKSWTDDDLESPAGGAGDDGAGTCLVYFMSPGLLAPLGCLAELVSGLAQGRHVVLVVDGECCQRLPDFAPVGTTTEAWKAVKKLWHERLLYVPDYHTPFCALLRQGITGGQSPPGGAASEPVPS